VPSCFLRNFVRQHAPPQELWTPNSSSTRHNSPSSATELLARIKQLPTQDTVAECFSLDELGVTAVAQAAAEAPVEVLESIFATIQSLLMTDRKYGDTSLAWAIDNNKSSAAVSLRRELTAARRATIALRTSLLLCIKHGNVYIRRSKRQRTETVALNTLLAFEVLNDNVWSHVMTFLRVPHAPVHACSTKIQQALLLL